MASPQAEAQSVSLHPDTMLGPVTLSVADLGRSQAFYLDTLGMQDMGGDDGEVIVGVASEPLLILRHKPGAIRQPDYSTGLYHVAILVPSRENLALVIRHLAETRYPLSGYSDHLVSEAFYLNDPDGHGLEIYRDRPRDEWPRRDGQLQMDSLPIDFNGFFDPVEGKAWTGMADGTRIGHMHLRVGDVARGREFYCNVIGFDFVMGLPTAAFVSAGGYHHHVGMNIWHSRKAPPPPPNSVGLEEFTILLQGDDERERALARLDAAGVTYQIEDGDIVLADPWQTGLRLHVVT